jgi:hypothetical protein
MPLILGTNSIKDTGYDVANSLRFDDGSSAYLNRSLGTPSNRKIFTCSAWVKKASTGTYPIFWFGADSDNWFMVKYESDSLRIESKNSGSTIIDVRTNALYRDFSAWYHVLVAVDTSQGTASNRIKIYVNGVQETSFQTSTYPNQDTDLNVITEAEIGNQHTTQYFDGYMAEVVFVDGTAQANTDLGEFDEDSPTIWKPKDVSGLTFGTNGFYLDFENSGSLGADVSGNGNNFTVNNLTSIDQSTDTCTNNFATLNSLNPTNQGTLSEGNLKLVSSSAYKIGVSTIAVSSGKWYVEHKITGSTPDAMVGVIDVQDYQSNTNILYAGRDTNSVGYYKDGRKAIGNSFSSYGATYTTNDIIGIALDLDSGTKTITFYKNGASQGSINLPTAGSEEWYFLPSPYNATIEMNFGSPPYSESGGNSDGNGYGNFAASVPANHYCLNTKNLAEYG